MNTFIWYYLGLLLFTLICLWGNAVCQIIAHKVIKKDRSSYLATSVFAYERTYKFLFYLGYLLGLIACAPIVYMYSVGIK